MLKSRPRAVDAPPSVPPPAGATPSRLGARRFAGTWAVLVLLLAVSFSLAHGATRPAPDREAGRGALATAQQLEDLGTRVAASPQLSDALDLVSRDLKAIEGLEVERQRASGSYRFHDRAVDYGVENVIARQPGDVDDALLVNVHVDSAMEGPGAADDGINVGAVLQAARQLAGQDHHRTVIYLFNGGEEVGLTGADAFTRHPWAADVRWFLNLEAVGSGGLPILFQSGEDDGRLIELAGNTARPYGSVLGQWLFQAGLINSDTDSRVWRAQGWSGLDYALFEDGYRYHTPNDRVAGIGSGSAQAVTDLTVRFASDVTGAADLGEPKPAPYYFDVLSRWWVTLDPLLAETGTLALLLALAALTWRACRVWGVRPGRVAATAGVALLGLPAAVLTGVVLGAAQSLVGPHSWFAHPWLVYGVTLPLVVLGALAPQLLLERRRRRRTSEGTRRPAARISLLGNAWAVALLGALTAWLGVGPGYLLWIASALLAVSIGGFLLLPGPWRAVPLLVSAFVSFVLIAQFARNLFELAVPMMGRLPAAIPMDAVVAVACTLVAVPLALILAPFAVHAGRPPRRTGLALVAYTACGLLAVGLVPPYDSAHPKLVSLFQEQTDGKDPRIVLEGRDYLTPEKLGIVDQVAGDTGLRVRDGALAARKVPVPEGTVSFDTAGTTAPVRITVGANRAELVRITVTGPGLSVGGRPFEGGEAVVDVVGRFDGHTVTVDRSGPVEIQVDQVFLRTGEDAEKALAALPEWTVGHARTLVTRTYADPRS
ncbi:M28 family peptidase [Streptomyces sp. Je 1-79]|uniref:M28 family peptidase n=1 Tax=Streptomyces sp. Je 1-79 TaxID=2943847 RepID=UPI0021A4C346|nr:M28 family peptidase [Streptomyces sp. Je 1-79]MCT4357645.1 M28 family peptidase [Streptomyces sp. Je 1-79]